VKNVLGTGPCFGDRLRNSSNSCPPLGRFGSGRLHLPGAGRSLGLGFCPGHGILVRFVRRHPPHYLNPTQASYPAGLDPKARLSGSRPSQLRAVCRGMPVNSEQDDCSFACQPFHKLAVPKRGEGMRHFEVATSEPVPSIRIPLSPDFEFRHSEVRSFPPQPASPSVSDRSLGMVEKARQQRAFAHAALVFRLPIRRSWGAPIAESLRPPQRIFPFCGDCRRRLSAITTAAGGWSTCRRKSVRTDKLSNKSFRVNIIGSQFFWMRQARSGPSKQGWK
jgi:hypothetical protein